MHITFTSVVKTHLADNRGYLFILCTRFFQLTPIYVIFYIYHNLNMYVVIETLPAMKMFT